MTEIKAKLKTRIPEALWQSARSSWNSIQNAGALPAATFHPWRRASIRRLGELKDIHRGQRCFIIGNGPSLKQTDLSLLKDEFTFGMNRIYLGFPEMGFQTTYFLTINSLVIEQCAADIRAPHDAALYFLALAPFDRDRTRSQFPPYHLYRPKIFDGRPRPPLGRRHCDQYRPSAGLSHGISASDPDWRGPQLFRPG